MPTAPRVPLPRSCARPYRLLVLEVLRWQGGVGFSASELTHRAVEFVAAMEKVARPAAKRRKSK